MIVVHPFQYTFDCEQNSSTFTGTMNDKIFVLLIEPGLLGWTALYPLLLLWLGRTNWAMSPDPSFTSPPKDVVKHLLIWWGLLQGTKVKQRERKNALILELCYSRSGAQVLTMTPPVLLMWSTEMQATKCYKPWTGCRSHHSLSGLLHYRLNLQ